MGRGRFFWPCIRITLGLLAGLSPVSAGLAQGIDLDEVNIHLPSEGAGEEGTLAVRLTFPLDIQNYRFPDGAPVAVLLPGGMKPGSLGGGQRIAEQGFVMVTFLYPGGRDGPFSSDGVYDNRGADCLLAVRDVLRFAMGAATDELGRTIDEIVPGPVRAGIVGLAPFSNGLAGLIALGRHGSEIPYAPYQVGWENPTAGQIITGDLGTKGDDCDSSTDSDGNGETEDDGRNPWYDPETGYGETSFLVDFSRIEFDPLYPGSYEDHAGVCPPVVQKGAVFHDGRTNGRVNMNPSQPGCADYDGDGLIEQDEDYRLGKWHTFDASCHLHVHYSLQTTQALEDAGIFAGGWPSWIATVAEADAFWELREATRYWDAIEERFPEFKAMTVFSRQDHVQSQDDHPHVRQVMDGLESRGMWYRLNADATYYQEANGSLPPGYVETDANAAVPKGTLKSHAEPGLGNEAMAGAGHAEMADRLYSGCWWPDLDGSLRPAAIPETEVATLTFAADGTRIDWTPASGAFCYDLLRGDVNALAAADGRVDLGDALCLDEDSPDTTAEDAASPPAGKAWYYVVKPNGLDGGYGASSSGWPRGDTGGACGG